MTGLRVLQPGMLSLLQDGGRFGQHRLGLTCGGPLDLPAQRCANALLHNPLDTTALEISFGGLQLEVLHDTMIAVTGGDSPFTINGAEREIWRSHAVRAGDMLGFGFARRFCRCYLAVAGGFTVTPQFGSTSTVPREGIGGLNGNRLAKNDVLPCVQTAARPCLNLPIEQRPHYSDQIQVRVIPGYQQQQFSRLQQRRFFSARYQVTDRADRMGYRLHGPAISCDIEGILSEGICHGAIQIPADGQPIVLLNDRQTIGGYPKIGSALSLDTALLGQLMPGAEVSFTAVTQYTAHNALHLAASRYSRLQALPCE
ncbi:biotin-dependent carboxyltransferase [Halieaceae bacterium IMCC14734]|uniref:Biotin-dependent carboxyltransferase n=1 Tax=Candidatus Litorirhabdus singularis TaxID=2518993 RepID=A0ABT3TFH7_9GAMM|nr:biotin-dependent carboxyltransferase family protein [Candidatus Litorirhabdus singularis]MCX2981068.1 biotin-dependent carboxyltransferase [Candidatus Litorirhabdus singularis]